MTIGIIGAGKLGVTLAQLATRAGYEVLISGSGNPEKIALSVEVLAPGAQARTSAQVAEESDLVILALPLSKFRELPVDSLRGKLIVDATNYWWEVDGPRHEIIPSSQSSSEAIQAFLADSRVIKAFNHMGYHDLHDEARPLEAREPKAIAVAGDGLSDVKTVSDFIEKIGFDSLYIGALSKGKVLEPGNPAFGANLPKDALLRVL